MVQLSPSLSLVSSSFRLSKSVFSVHSCRFCAVRLLFSLGRSDTTASTAIKVETVALNCYTHLFPSLCIESLSKRVLTVDTEGDAD